MVAPSFSPRKWSRTSSRRLPRTLHSLITSSQICLESPHPRWVSVSFRFQHMKAFSSITHQSYHRLRKNEGHKQDWLPMNGSADVVVKIDDKVDRTEASNGSHSKRLGSPDSKVACTTIPSAVVNQNSQVSATANLRQRTVVNDGKSDPSVDANGQREQVIQTGANGEKGNLWREVSYDYLNDLMENHSKSERWKSRNRTKQRSRSFDFDIDLDPPSKLIGEFLQRQKASGNLALDMDMDMEELSNVADRSHISAAERNLSSLSEGSETNLVSNQQLEASSSRTTVSTPACDLSRTSTRRESRTVSFEPSPLRDPLEAQQGPPLLVESPTYRAGNNDSSTSNSSQDESSTSQDESSDSDEIKALRNPRIASLNRAQTRSRLADPPLPMELRQENLSEVKGDLKSTQLKSTQLRSGLLGGIGGLAKVDEEEDDPFKDTDVPQEFKKNSWDAVSFLEWIAFVLIMGWLVCSLTIPGLTALKLWNMVLWKWALLVLLVFCGRLVSGWIIRIVVFCLERSFLLRKRVLYFVYALRKGAQNCIWFAFALIAWRFIFFPKVENTATHRQKVILSYVTSVLSCFLIAATIWLLKIFCVKVLASSFHVSTYFDRIQESLFSQYVLETLSGPPLIELENEDKKLIEEVKGFKKAGLKVPDLPELRKKGEVKGPSGIRARQSGVIGGGKSGLIGSGNSGVIGGGKSGLIGGKSGMIGTGKSGMIGVGKSGMIGLGKSGMIRVGKSGILGKSQGAAEGKEVEDVITVDHLHKLNQKNISAWNMKRLINLVKYRGITTLAHAIDASAYDQDVEIQSEWQARAAARKIFKNVAKPGARYICQVDLMRFLPREDVIRAMRLFEEGTETGKISKNALKDFVVHVFRERRALALTLNDTKTAVRKLHRMIDILICIITIVIWLLVLNITTTHLLLFLSSQLLLMVFIFGNTCKTLFECIIFLFVMHPLDVGDRCMVDGNQMVVEEINILSTSFMRYDGEKVWYPNSLLATKAIFNYYRTPDTGDTFNFSVHMSTPAEKITALRERIGRYIESKSSHWTSDFNIIVQEIEDMNRMKMQLMVNHTINFHDVLERQIRRSHLILEVKRYFEELQIEYQMLPQEVRVRES